MKLRSSALGLLNASVAPSGRRGMTQTLKMMRLAVLLVRIIIGSGNVQGRNR